MTKADLVPVNAMLHPDAELAMAFWRDRPADGLRIGRDLPSRAVARLLSRVAVCKPAGESEDYRVHLSGETVNQRFGRDITGESVSEIFSDPDERQARLDSVKAALETGEPSMARVTYRCGTVEVMRHEVVVLPLTAPNGKDRWALVFAFYF